MYKSGTTTWALVLVASALGSTVALAEPAPEVGQIRLPGRGLTATGGEVGYFPAAKGGLEAIDLTTGKLLWTSEEASSPLAVDGSRLYARAIVKGKPNELRVVALTTKGGKLDLKSDPVELPDWVAIGSQHGRLFATGASPDKGGLLLSWEARGWYSGGIAPSPKMQADARKSASGSVRVDLETGKVRVFKMDEVPKGMPMATESYPVTAEVGGRTFTVVDGPFNPGNPASARRALQAKDASGKVLWSRDIAAPVLLLAIP